MSKTSAVITLIIIALIIYAIIWFYNYTQHRFELDDTRLEAGCTPLTDDQYGRGVIWECPIGIDKEKLELELE